MSAEDATETPEAGYLRFASGDGFLSIGHAPVAPATGVGVLVVPPFGWEETASYRARRDWAVRLAGLGHDVLRIDLPATGDSSGGPADPAVVARWVEAVAGAARTLRADPGVRRVAVVGLGLGGLLAVAAAGAGAFEDLVLWGAPASGRAAVRQQRAFARLQSDRHGDEGAVPDGWLETGGFVLSAETLADLAALDAASGPGLLRRLLVLPRTGPAEDAGAASELVSSTVELELGDGSGYDALVDHPERVVLPDGPTEQVERWLAAASVEPPADPAPRPLERSERLTVPGHYEERMISVEGRHGALTGILTTPCDTAPDVCAVFLSAGAVRRTGPSRLWADAARRAASVGVAALRLDLPGVGDSDGDSRDLADVRRFYEPDLTPDVRLALDHLSELGLGPRFVAVGLCSGGYYAFRVADDDERVREAILLNPGALDWDASAIDRLRAHKLARVRSGTAWRRLVTGDIQAAQLVASARAVPTALRERRRRRPGETPAAAALDRMRGRGTRVALAFSGEEALEAVLHAEGVLDGAGGRWPGLVVSALPGRDHTLRPLRAQRAALDLLERSLASAGPR